MRSMFHSFILFIGVTGISLLAGSSSAQHAAPASEGAKPGTEQVAIDNFQFTPSALTVKAGTTVVFTNKDDVPHTVVGEGDTFRSQALDTDEHYTHRFATPGTYKYFCSLHPKMTGTIMVQ